MKLDSIVKLYEPEDTHIYVRSLLKTEEMQKSYDNGGFVYQVVQKFAAKPSFFFRASDEILERAHFSAWWGGVQLRDYDNPYIHDLYILHEIIHAGTLVYSDDLTFQAFCKKMWDNELDASVLSEIAVYFLIPGLRDKSFPHDIYADRFLNDPYWQALWQNAPDRAFQQMRLLRHNIMTTDYSALHEDLTEVWINRFSRQNEVWANIWVHRYREVEKTMSRLQLMADQGRRQEALDAHIGWLLSEDVTPKGTDIPFPSEAEVFAGTYWMNKKYYTMAFSQQSPAAANPAPAAEPS